MFAFKLSYYSFRHIHQKQKPQQNIYYTGTPFQHSFGSCNNNTISYFVLLNTKYDKIQFKINEVNLYLPKKKIIYKNINNINNFKIPEESNNDSIKLTLTGNYNEFKSFKKLNSTILF